MSGNSKQAYNTLKALSKTQQRKSEVIEDSRNDILTESTAVFNRWTEYCSGLHSYELHPDTSLHQSGHSRSSYLYQRKTTSGNVRTIVPSACTMTQQRKSEVIEDSRNDILTESTGVFSRWTEYCSGLHTPSSFFCTG